MQSLFCQNYKKVLTLAMVLACSAKSLMTFYDSVVVFFFKL